MRAKGLLLLVALAFVGCTATRVQEVAPPDHFTQVTRDGVRYAHNWHARPCFSIVVADNDWVLDEADADRVLFRRHEEVLNVYFTDNREVRFAVGGMSAQDALRAFIGYEADFVKPMFRFQTIEKPRFGEDDNGSWAQWSWEGRSGKARGAGRTPPADQRHVVASLWLDPWVLSFDWATTDVGAAYFGPTPEMIDVLDTLKFHPECFDTMAVGETRSD